MRGRADSNVRIIRGTYCTGTVFVADHISSSTCYASKARIDKRNTFCMLEVEMRYPFVTLIMPALFTLAEAREMWSQATCGSCGLAAPWMQRWVTELKNRFIDPIDPTCNTWFSEGKNTSFLLAEATNAAGDWGRCRSWPFGAGIRGMSRCQVIWLGDLREGPTVQKAFATGCLRRGSINIEIIWKKYG